MSIQASEVYDLVAGVNPDFLTPILLGTCPTEIPFFNTPSGWGRWENGYIVSNGQVLADRVEDNNKMLNEAMEDIL